MVSLFVKGSMGLEGFIGYIDIFESVLFQPICLVCVTAMSLIMTFLVGLGCYVWRPFDISLVLLPWIYPAPHRQAPLVEGF